MYHHEYKFDDATFESILESVARGEPWRTLDAKFTARPGIFFEIYNNFRSRIWAKAEIDDEAGSDVSLIRLAVSAHTYWYWQRPGVTIESGMADWVDSKAILDFARVLGSKGMGIPDMTAEIPRNFWEREERYLPFVSFYESRFGEIEPQLFHFFFILADYAERECGCMEFRKLVAADDMEAVSIYSLTALKKVYQDEQSFRRQYGETGERFEAKSSGENAYYFGAKEFQDKSKLMTAIEGYTRGKTASETAKATGLSRQSITKLFQKLNDRLIEHRLGILDDRFNREGFYAAAAYHYMYYVRTGIDRIDKNLAEAYEYVACITMTNVYSPAFSMKEFLRYWDKREEIEFLDRISKNMKGIPPNKFAGYYILAEMRVIVKSQFPELSDGLSLNGAIDRVVVNILKKYPLDDRQNKDYSNHLMGKAMPILMRSQTMKNVDERQRVAFPTGIKGWIHKMEE